MAQLAKFLSSTAGVASGGGATLDVNDVFSCHLYDGTGSAQVIENGIALGNSNDGGSVKFGNSGDQYGNKALVVADNTDFQFGTGNWTIEAFVYPIKDDNFVVCSWGESSGIRWDFGWQSSSNPRIMVNTSSSSQTSTASSTPISGYLGQWVHMACVRNGSDITLYVGGVAKTTMSYTGSSFPNPSTGGVNIGARFFTGQSNVENSSFGYITDFRIVKGTAVYTSNFTPSTSALTAISGTSFLALSGDTPLVDQSSNSHSISQNSLNSGNAVASEFGRFTGTGGEGGLVWHKSRTSTQTHFISDTERGATKLLSPNNTDAEETQQGLTSFNSNGFTVNNLFANASGEDYVSWTFRKAEKFFTCVKYTGNGVAGRTISHDLNNLVGMLIIKCTSHTSDWSVQHRMLPPSKYLALNETTSQQTDTARFHSTAAGTSTFSVGSGNAVNGSGRTYVAYLFSHNNSGNPGEFGPSADQDIIKCGSYTGNGSTTGVFQDLGFEPQWIMFKLSNGTDPWVMLDNMRGVSGAGSNDPRLQANSSVAEAGGEIMQFNATGFTPLTADDKVNGSGKSYIYMAIRRGPLAAPTDPTKVFAPVNHPNDASDVLVSPGFTTDMVLTTKRAEISNRYVATRLTGARVLNTKNADTESGDYSQYMEFDHQNGVFWKDLWGNQSAIDYHWKRAPGYLDVCCYKGNNNYYTSQNVTHNLGVVPEMIWIKNRDRSASWVVYNKTIGAQKKLDLNGTSGASANDSSYFNNTTPTSSVFTVGNSNRVNQANENHIAYLFATVANVSKVGSFTLGSSGSTNIDCGFSSGARFIFAKKTSGTGGFLVWDTVRGIVAGNDPYLLLNSNAVETGGYDFVDPYSQGFTIPEASYWGAGDYIFYAIA